MAKVDETKPLARLKTSLSTGNMWLAILSIMKKRKVYAYALPESIEKQFGYKPSRIMMYLVLYKLEAEGLIKSEFEERRKYYAPTPAGTAAIRAAKSYLKLLAKRL